MTTITFYTSHTCPWAHRVHIALSELGLKFEEVLIDLDKPREPWYLEINPRGLVPALKYGDHLIIESGVITQFLADLKESPLLPSSGSVEGALARARINFFNDTFANKVITPLFSGLMGPDELRLAKANQLVEGIEKHIVPLLEDAGPFFGGSKQLTHAEVNTASFVLRILAFSKPKHQVLPPLVEERLKGIKAWQSWVNALLAEPSVVGIWDEDLMIVRTKKKLLELSKK